MVKKRFLWGLVLAAAVLVAAWMLWPRPLAGAFDAKRQFVASVTVSGLEVEAMVSHPTMETTPYTAAAGSPEGAAVRAVLERYSYHPCLDSLTVEDSLEDTGKLSILLYNNAEETLHVFSGTGKLFCNGRVVRVGYWGNREAEKLCEELAAALEGNNAG